MTVPAIAAEPVLLHAAGSLRAALTEVASAFEAASGQQGAGEVRPVGHAQGRDRRRRAGRGVRLRQHGASAGAGDGGQERPGRAVRAQPAVRAGAAGARGRVRDPARAHARSAASSSAPRRRAPTRPATTPGRCSARPTSIKPGAFAPLEKKALQLTGGPGSPPPPPGRNRLRRARRRGQSRHLPHLLHQRAGGAAARIPASRSWRCRTSSRSAPTTG